MKYNAPTADIQNPSPVEPQRRRLVKETARLRPSFSLSVPSEVSEQWERRINQECGRLGGLATLEKYGRNWFSNLARFRNHTINREEFEVNKKALLGHHQNGVSS